MRLPILPITQLLTFAGLLGTASLAAAQTSAPGPATCTCRADLDTLAAKIERNYVAWHLEVAGGPREQEFRRFLTGLQQQADNTSDELCIFILRAMTDWFRDGHLFVFEQPPISAEEAARLASAAAVRPIDEAAVRADLQRRTGRRDPIEGIWYAPGYRMAVVRGAPDDSSEFVGVILNADSAHWKRGQVKARFTAHPDGSYRTILFADDRSRRQMDATIYRNLLLNTPLMTWGREFPLAGHEVGALDPRNPLRPTIRLDGGDAVIVSVPSHDPSLGPVLDSLVKQHRAAIVSRPYLVIDIRGDRGGSSQMTAPLVPFLVTPSQRPAIGPRGLSMVVSSPDNIRYFQRGWNPDSVAQRMTGAPGQVIPLMRTEELGMPFPTDTILTLPRRVGVLMDHGVASAGEAFVLQARKSTKTTLYGDNTQGMIDYQSVMLVRLACRARGILLGYPMIAASATLPKDGLNAAGIPPDVRIDATSSDQVAAVLRHLRSTPR